MTQSPPAAVAFLDGTGRVLSANVAWLAELPPILEAAASVGSNLTDVLRKAEAAGDLGARLAEGLEAVLGGRQETAEFEVPGRLAGAKTLVCMSRAVPNQPGLGAGIVLVRPRNGGNAGSDDMLRQAQRMEAVGRVAGGVAHDFNNILTAINGYAQLLLTELKEEDPKRADVEEILKAGERAAELTRKLLTLSRRQIKKHSVLNLNAVLSDMTGMLRPMLGEDVELSIVTASDLGNVRADRGQLEQVLVNLAVNARDAMPKGGRLSIETFNGVVPEPEAGRLGIRPGGCVGVRVRDTGSGMDAATREQIFEPFFTTKGSKGTGLGLSIVYGIVRQSEGAIRVESEVGRGTTFTILLPRVDATAEAREGESPLPAPGRGETILLVEDEESVRALLSRVLSAEGYRVLAAGGAEDAERICREHREGIHLMITDVVLPKVSGRELAARIQAVSPTIRSLFVTGYNMSGVVRHGGRLDPGTILLQKPFKPAALIRTVRQVLDSEPHGPTSGSSRSAESRRRV